MFYLIHIQPICYIQHAACSVLLEQCSVIYVSREEAVENGRGEDKMGREEVSHTRKQGWGEGSADQSHCTVFLERFDDVKNHNYGAVTSI